MSTYRWMEEEYNEYGEVTRPPVLMAWDYAEQPEAEYEYHAPEGHEGELLCMGCGEWHEPPAGWECER